MPTNRPSTAFAVLLAVIFSSLCAGLPVNAEILPEGISQNLILAPSDTNPRNSEGAFATLRSGRIIYCYSQFSGGTSDFSPCQIAEIVSDDQGRTWSEPSALFTPEPKTMEMSASILRLALRTLPSDLNHRA